MRIVLTGGGTGGHFYPIIAIAERIEEIVLEKTLIEPELVYIGPTPFDEAALVEHDIRYLPSAAGKLRQYASIFNVLGAFVTGFGVVRALFQLFSLYPDVVFSTGGYAAFPTLLAARILAIPVVMYDADAKPGRVSLWSSHFAHWIAIAHAEAAGAYTASVRERIALTGHPIRKEIEEPAKEGGYEFLKLDSSVPTILVLGGSQGAQAINNVVLDALPSLIEKYNILHQVGKANLEEVGGIANVALHNSPLKERYRAFGLLNTFAMRLAAGISTLVIARAGSGTIFEIAAWGKPSILIPLPLDVSRDQTENAFSYARAGATTVIEQKNLTPHILEAEIDRIATDQERQQALAQAATAFSRPGAARTLAEIILETALQHEPV